MTIYLSVFYIKINPFPTLSQFATAYFIDFDSPKGPEDPSTTLPKKPPRPTRPQSSGGPPPEQAQWWGTMLDDLGRRGTYIHLPIPGH